MQLIYGLINAFQKPFLNFINGPGIGALFFAVPGIGAKPAPVFAYIGII